MKSVDQTKFGYPEGNCLMACVASILEVGLDDLPDLFERCCIQREDGVFWEGGEYWLDVLQEGVEALGARPARSPTRMFRWATPSNPGPYSASSKR